jgi:response regulator of citrate/malate metabolism
MILNILGQMQKSVEAINGKMDVFIELQTNTHKDPVSLNTPLDIMTLITLPDHLRKTAMIICRSERATAEQIAKQTNRARAVESSYLNQLVVMGHIKKQRKGRKTYFYVDTE